MSSVNSHPSRFNTRLGKITTSSAVYEFGCCLNFYQMAEYCINSRFIHIRYDRSCSIDNLYTYSLCEKTIKLKTVSEFMNSWCGGYFYHFNHQQYFHKSCVTVSYNKIIDSSPHILYQQSLCEWFTSHITISIIHNISKNLVSQSLTTENRLFPSYINNLYL